MSAVDDLFSKNQPMAGPAGGPVGMPHGITIIIIPHGGSQPAGPDDDSQGQGQDVGDEVGKAIGTPFSFRDGEAPDGHGDASIPLDAPSDCSGFIANLIAHLSNNKIRLPDLTDSQADETEPVAPDKAAPGDLLFSRYQGQGPIGLGHVSMLLDKHGPTPDGWSALEQSTAPGLTTGKPGIDIRQADHAIQQGGQMIVRRVPGLDQFLGRGNRAPG